VIVDLISPCLYLVWNLAIEADRQDHASIYFRFIPMDIKGGNCSCQILIKLARLEAAQSKVYLYFNWLFILFINSST
jgi:hypothetical protein